jgi:hypothetical protein
MMSLVARRFDEQAPATPPFTSADMDRIARQLAKGRRVSRNGDGRKSYCPLCEPENRPQKPRPTLSVAARGGQPLFFCHRCRRDGRDIIQELVRLGLLPNSFKKSSQVLATVDQVLRGAVASDWKRIGGANALKVLMAVCGIAQRCFRNVVAASERDVADLADLSAAAAGRALKRLARDGWLERVERCNGKKAARWRLQIPPSKTRIEPSQSKPAEEVGDRMKQIDPCFIRGGRAASSRPAASFRHDLFRSTRGGLGPVKGRVYEVLKTPMTSAQISKALGLRCRRNATIHTRALILEGLVRRLADGRYERTAANLDGIAARRGVLGAGERQREQHAKERQLWRRWCDALDHYRETGEVLEPATGLVLARLSVLPRYKMRDFRRIVSLLEQSRRQHLPNSESRRADTSTKGSASNILLQDRDGARHVLIAPELPE